MSNFNNYKVLLIISRLIQTVSTDFQVQICYKCARFSEQSDQVSIIICTLAIINVLFVSFLFLQHKVVYPILCGIILNRRVLCDNDLADKLVEFIVISHCNLKVSWVYSVSILLFSTVTCQLQDFSSEVFKCCSHDNSSSDSNLICISSF